MEFSSKWILAKVFTINTSFLKKKGGGGSGEGGWVGSGVNAPLHSPAQAAAGSSSRPTDRGPMGLGQYDSLGEYYGPRTASLCFLFLLHNYSFFSVTLCSDEPEVFLSEYSQIAILHAAHFRRVVNTMCNSL